MHCANCKSEWAREDGHHLTFINNCIGCVKGGMGYWNHIRVDFPDVFKSRAEMERAIGASCINGTFLDELNPEVGRHAPPVVEDCGIACELIAL